MNNYEKAMAKLEEKFGNYKDNVLGLATVAIETNSKGAPRPVVRDVDAYYEDGAFYLTTNAQSNKVLQIAQNNEVAIAVNFEWFTATGTGENLGWVMKSENAELRTKLRKAFEAWYDKANNEKDENLCILKIELKDGTLNINHGETMIYYDFASKNATIKGKEV